MAYRSFLEVLAGSYPPRYAASLKSSSPRFTHSSWREDGKRRVFTHARKLCRNRSAAALRDIEDEKTAARIAANVASAKVVAAVVSLARADVRHAKGPRTGTPIRGH
jgi:hypothetical protein